MREDEDGIVPLAGCGGREPYLTDRVRVRLEEELEDLKAFKERLDSVIQGTVKVKLPKWANGPYRNGAPP